MSDLEFRGILLQPQVSPVGAKPASESCDRNCVQGEWCRSWNDKLTDECRPGANKYCLCSRPDIQMCPSAVPPADHQVGRLNPKPKGTLPQGPLSARFQLQDIHERTDTAATHAERNKAKNIECVYQADAIKTSDDVLTWIDNFGEDETWRTKIMPRFCGTKISKEECKVEVGADENGCSRFFAQGEGGRMCKDWSKDPRNASLFEGQIKKLCAGRVGTYPVECACHRRSDDELYKKVIAQSFRRPVPDKCWWSDCNHPFRLIPPSVAKETCPDQYCEVVVEAAEHVKVELYDLEQKLACPISRPTTDGGDDDGPPASNKLWIWIGVGVAGVLIVVLLLWYYLRNRKTNLVPK